MSESALRDKLGAELARRKKRGDPIWYLKVHGGPYQRAGVWDWLICYDGRMAAIETKDPAEGDRAAELDLTPLQRVELRDMARARVTCLASRDWPQILRFLEDFCGRN